MNRFFVYHPVFAWVISLLVILFGGIALTNLGVEQYPEIAPPQLRISATFSGADAATVDRSVTSIIEKELNGIDDFLYMSSTSRSNGTANITVTFKNGTDLDTARSNVQERIASVEPRLPEEVRQRGIRITRSSSNFLMLVTLKSRSGATSALEMGNYASNNIVDELGRIPGVGDVTLFGSSFAMRIWLDRERLSGFGLSAAEVLAAIREQNSQTAGGGLGLQPTADGTEFTAQIITQDRFTTAQQFRQIIIRANSDGSTVRLGDVARVELGRDNYGFRLTMNGTETAGMAISLTTGANALGTANAVRQRLSELESAFPPDIGWAIPFDTTPFVTASVTSVVETMVQALILVAAVVFLFLQSWRTMFVPTIIVPIALVGACLGLLLFGFSINVLSLFAMIVAIGILNDDAIVIVENVERIMAEEGLDPREATAKAMGQLTGAIVATTLVLLAVFTPMGFFPGSTGVIYRQFAVTLGVSLVISTILSLTLAPALCGALLRPKQERPEGYEPGLKDRFFGGFNRWMDRMTNRYSNGVAAMLLSPGRWLLVFGGATLFAIFMFSRLPGGFLPSEDQGFVFVAYTGPPGSTMERTQTAIKQAEAFMEKQPEIRNYVSIVGFSMFGQGQSAAMSFVDLHPWGQRAGADESADALVRRANAAFSTIPQAMVFAFSPPAIPALGNAMGFSMKLEDRSGQGGEALQAAAMQLAVAAAQSPVLVGVRPEGMPSAPQLSLQVDRTRARALGLQIGQINQALSVAFGSAYVNDFIHEGNTLRVFVQGDASQRMRPEDIAALRVRNDRGQMVPFSAFSTMRWGSGPQQLERYNGFPSATISGQAAPGYSSGAALDEMERIARETLPGHFTPQWTGTAFEEREAGGQIGLLLLLSVFLVFLLLAALYESWMMPVVILLIIPLGAIGAVLFTMARGMSADVYFNVGLITIIGLAAKNAILIVQFALDEEADGKDPHTAALSAARQRLRPIIMTSLTFVIGMLPLVVASGAGAASRQAVGTGVMGSMLTATAFGIFFTPLFYYTARNWIARRKSGEASPNE